MVLEFDIDKDSDAAEEFLYGAEMAMEKCAEKYGEVSVLDIRKIVEDNFKFYSVSDFVSEEDIYRPLIKLFTNELIDSARMNGYLSRRSGRHF